jgi:endogenous inhibitor of DNA gyrase (YacG/DUF329 family)
MATIRTIYRTCPTCGRSFGQPDDPGRKRRFCSAACKQAAYRARKRREQEARRRAEEEAARRAREEARRQRDRARSHQPPPHAGTSRPAPSAGPAAGTAAPTPCTTTRPAHDRAPRRYDGLHAKAASTGFPEEAAACRAKAEQLRAKYGL